MTTCSTGSTAPDPSPTDRYRAARDLLLDCHGDPDRAAATFRFPDVGPRFNWAHDWFDAVARGQRRDALTVVAEDGRRDTLSFDEMARRSNQVGAWLLERGVGRGDPVVLMVGNEPVLWEAMLAIMKVGAVIVPTTTALGPAELADRVARSGATHVICTPADTAKFDAVPGDYGRLCVGRVPGWADLGEAYGWPGAALGHPGTAPDDPLLYYFTSGTTTRPKLVAHSQVSYPVGHLSTMYWLGLRPGDRHCNISSPGWAKHAWSCLFAPWAAEATVYVLGYARFDPERLLERLREDMVTTFCAPPTVWRMLVTCELSPRPAALREVVAAGEPLNPEVIAQVERHWGLTVRDGYGQTETTASVGNPPGGRVKRGSMGHPLPGVPVTLLDVADGTPLEGPGEGEVCLDLGARPISLMTGYLGDPERHTEAMYGGYYHTGDVASMDPEGYITFVGRTDDVFKASDYKVSPFEVESVLVEHPAVAEAAVVPAPDAVRLNVVKAYVALAPGAVADQATAHALLQFARDRLAPYQRVRRVEFADLPKTISGKIRRVELRAREAALGGAQPEGEWRVEQFDDLRG